MPFARKDFVSTTQFGEAQDLDLIRRCEAELFGLASTKGTEQPKNAAAGKPAAQDRPIASFWCATPTPAQVD